MDLEKVYQDSEGRLCNILQMVQREPEWAANIIQEYEKRLKHLQQPENEHAPPADGKDALPKGKRHFSSVHGSS